MRRVFFLGLVLFCLGGCVTGVELYKPVKNCTYNGQTYLPGSERIPADDSCNTCICDKNAKITCTKKTCLSDDAILKLGNPAAVKCAEDGYAYEIRKVADGSEVGYCLDQAAHSCPSWEYFRGECVLGETQLIFRAQLNDVSGGASFGVAKVALANQKFTLTLSAQLPSQTEDFYYEGWMIQTLPILDKVSLGQLVPGVNQGEYQLGFESPENFLDHERIVITLVQRDDQSVTKNILEGNLLKITNQ